MEILHLQQVDSDYEENSIVIADNNPILYTERRKNENELHRFQFMINASRVQLRKAASARQIAGNNEKPNWIRFFATFFFLFFNYRIQSVIQSNVQ